MFFSYNILLALIMNLHKVSNNNNNFKVLAYILSQNILSFLKIFSILFELFYYFNNTVSTFYLLLL